MSAALDKHDAMLARPGLEGGRYQPLGQEELARIDETVLTLLETVGFANAIPGRIEALTRVGASCGADGRIRFPRELVVSTMQSAARNFTLHGQDPRRHAGAGHPGSLRHGRRRRASGRCREAPIPGIGIAGSV